MRRAPAPTPATERSRAGGIGALFRNLASDYAALRATKYGAAPILILILLDFVQKFDDAIFGLLLPEIRRDFGVPLTLIVALGSVIGVILSLLSPVIGYLADRTRRTVMLGLSAIASGVFSMLSATAKGVYSMAGFRAVDEASESFGNIPTSSLVADYYPVDVRGKVYAVASVPLRVAGLIAPAMVGLVAARYGWRAPFLFVGLPLALTGVVALLRLREPVRGYFERRMRGAGEDIAGREEAPVGWGEATRTLFAIRTLRRQILASMFILVGGSGYGLGFNFLLSEEFHLSPFERGLIFVPAGVAGIFGILMGGRVSDRLVRHRPGRVLGVLGGLTAVGGISILLIGLIPSIPLVVLLSVAFGFAGGLVAPASYTIGSLILPPRMRAQGLGILVFIATPVSVVAPNIFAYLGTQHGFRTALLVAAPLYVIGGLLFASASPFFQTDMRSAIASAMASEEYRRARDEGRTRLLMCRDVDVHYGAVQVLFGVNLVVDEGEIVALLGTNGAGKSTLLRAVSGIQQASAGAILYEGRDITHVPPNEIARMGIVLMPGGRGVFPSLTVRENLDIATAAIEDAAERLDEVFGFFPVLHDRLGQPVGSLSGGEQQMVALAQAFLSKPRVLMIDELSLGLAPAVVQQLLEIVRAIHERGTTIVLVEQSVNVALTVARRAVFMEKGEVRFDGPTADLLRRPDIMRAVYLRGSGGLTERPPVSLPDAAAAAEEAPARAILSVEGLTKRFGGRTAVDEVTFELREGEALGVIGPNGAGKTTLFDLISGYLPADSGRVVLDGADISRLGPDARARKRLVRRFQDARVFPSLTVFEAICVALERHLEVRNTFVTALQIPSVRRGEARVRARAQRLIELLGLEASRDKFVSELSTGLRRVVDIACVLAAEPKVLMLDEPSAGIAQAEAEMLGPLLRRVRFETGCSMLVIEHDMPLISAVSDELLAMVQGAVVTRGSPHEVLSHPQVVKAYLGTSEEALRRSGVLVQ